MPDGIIDSIHVVLLGEPVLFGDVEADQILQVRGFLPQLVEIVFRFQFIPPVLINFGGGILSVLLIILQSLNVFPSFFRGNLSLLLPFCFSAPHLLPVRFLVEFHFRLLEQLRHFPLPRLL